MLILFTVFLLSIEYFIYLSSNLYCFLLSVNFGFCYTSFQFFLLFVFVCAGFLMQHMCSLLLFLGFLQSCWMGATLQLQHAGFSLQWLLPLWSTGFRVYRLHYLLHIGSVIAAHGLRCQGSNPYPLHWQVGSQPLNNQESPFIYIFKV